LTALGERSLVVVTGAGGPAGHAVVRALVERGVHVVGADVDQARLDELTRTLGPSAQAGFHGEQVDLLDSEGVSIWADRVAAGHPTGSARVDGVVHLVGGWRGGARFVDNTPADAEWLLSLLVRTLRNVSLAFHDHLLASARGQFVIVSATAASKPTAGNAAYAAAKAAAEAWTAALADSFRRLQVDRPVTAAATTLVVKALVHDALRQSWPDHAFAGYTDVATLADEVVALWARDAETTNGRRLELAS
jgi:NADP-dependent 3-hydroxy acid dehydrogenase YdfG